MFVLIGYEEGCVMIEFDYVDDGVIVCVMFKCLFVNVFIVDGL